MTKTGAEQIALQYLKRVEARTGIELILLDRFTQERTFGWVFFYDSKCHAQTLNVSNALAGNGPIVVTKDGRLHETGTALPLETYLQKFEKP